MARGLILSLVGLWATAFAPAPVAAFPNSASTTLVGLQCDAKRNVALIRLGRGLPGHPPHYVGLPAGARQVNAPVVAIPRQRDGICRLANGLEIKVRRYDHTFRLVGACGRQLLVVWAGGRRIIGPTGIDPFLCNPVASRDEPLLTQMRNGEVLGWIIAPGRMEVCLRVVAWTPGPSMQCRVIGDPARAGIRDAVEYPADGPRPRRGQLRAHYARDAGFCESFIRRGVNGTADELFIPDRLARPIFVDGRARFDFDNDGVEDDVLVRSAIYPGPVGSFMLGDVATSDAVRDVIGVFFNRGRTQVLTAQAGSAYGPVRDAGTVSEILPQTARQRVRLRHICRFHRVGGEEPDIYRERAQ